VMSVEDYRSAIEAPELEVGAPEEILRFPNGEPGFYFVRIAYSEHARELIGERHHPNKSQVEGEAVTEGERWRVRHPVLDNGVIGNAFDGNLETLARTRDAPVTVVEVTFPAPRPVEGVRLHLWYEEYEYRMVVVRTGGDVVTAEGTCDRRIELTPLELYLSEPVPDAVSAEVTISKAKDGHVHLREIEFLPAPATQ